jgi:hypothetical protein
VKDYGAKLAQKGWGVAELSGQVSRDGRRGVCGGGVIRSLVTELDYSSNAEIRFQSFFMLPAVPLRFVEQLLRVKVPTLVSVSPIGIFALRVVVQHHHLDVRCGFCSAGRH